MFGLIPKLLAGALIAALAGLAVQTWRLDRCQARAARLTTCEEVRAINKEVRDATDDDLADRISAPR